MCFGEGIVLELMNINFTDNAKLLLKRSNINRRGTLF